MRYLNKFQLLYEHQYGFRAGHNTEQPVVHLLDKIYNALNSPEGSQYTLAIFIDLTKAFDTCPVDVLLHKLNFYGFRGVANTWFRNYLTSRRQYVAIRGEHSSHKEISMGVPQGSILGPILFILLINDLPNASKLFFTLLYADDTTLKISSSDLQFLYKTANSELEKLTDWFRANQLTLNTSKTKYIPFQRNLLHPTMALKLGWRKNFTYTFPGPGYLVTSIAIQIKSDDTKPNMVDTTLMCRISNKNKHCIL